MAKHLIHANSNLLVEGSPKLPAAERINYGELAVNYAKDHETISLKNSDNEIVTFSSDKAIMEVIKQNEKITAAALNDLYSREVQITVSDVVTEGDDNPVSGDAVFNAISDTETALATHAAQVGSSENIGHVKAGDNVTIDQNGAISVDVESGVTENSTKPVTSGDVYTAISGTQTALTTHAEQAGSSENIGHVKAGDNVTIDQNGALSVDVESGVTENSTKPVTSGDVYTAITERELVISSALNDLDTRQKSHEEQVATSNDIGHVKPGNNITIDNNGALSVDMASAITENNTKPVTSGDVYNAIYGAGSALATHAAQVGTSNEIGHVKAGDNIIIDQNGAVSVDVATAITENNTKPVTAGKVYDAFNENELIISSSLNDLNLRISLLEDENILLKQRITVLENNA